MQFSPLRQHAPPEFDRDQHIDEVLATFPGSSALVDDRSLLQVPCPLAGGRTTSIRINLPATFPRTRPALSLTSHVQHAWVDTVCRLVPPLLEDWGFSGVRLATVLRQAAAGVSTAPLSSPGPPPRSSPPRRDVSMRLPFFSSDSQNAAQAPQPQQQQQPGAAAAAATPPRIPPPSEFPQLGVMSTFELEQALKDRASYLALLSRVQAQTSAQEAAGGGGNSGLPPVVAAMRRSNAELARANLARERELAELRTQIAIVRTSGYDAARAEFEDKFARQEAVREQIAPERLIERLHEAAKAAAEQSEALERRLHAGELGVEEFVAQYTAARMRYHSRDLKYQAALQTIPTNTPAAPCP